MLTVSARAKSFVIAAVLGAVLTGITVIPAKAVPIGRGLSALSVMFEEALPQKAELIFFAQSLSSCGSPATIMNPLKLTLLTIGADNPLDFSNQAGGANGGTQ